MRNKANSVRADSLSYKLYKLCLRYFQAVCENKKLFDHLNMEWIIGPGPKDHTSVMDFNVSFRYVHYTVYTTLCLFKCSSHWF